MTEINIADFYKDQGYLLVKGLYTPAEVEDMRRGVDRMIERASQSNRDHNSAWQGDYLAPEQLKKLVLKGFHDVHYHDAVFTKALLHPKIVQVLQQIIGPNVQLHHSKMLVKPPSNGAAFPLHQDYLYFPHAEHTMLAASIHLDDADEQNGCIAVVPQSHKQGILPHVGRHYLDHKQYPLSIATPCLAEAGDVLFFNYLTIHGSGPNYSNRTRRNILFQYRSATDLPIEKVHQSWGMGLMVCGENPDFINASTHKQ